MRPCFIEKRLIFWSQTYSEPTSYVPMCRKPEIVSETFNLPNIDSRNL